MTKIRNCGFLVGYLLFVLLFTGCFGGGTTKSYTLTVTVQDKETSLVVENAKVIVTSTKGTTDKTTSSNGVAIFESLTGAIEILVQAPGYTDQTEPQFTINQNRKITIKLEAKENNLKPTSVTDEDGLLEALDDPTVESIAILENIALSQNVVIDRPVKLELKKTVTGTINYNFADVAELELSGPGELKGDLIINAPQATITNHLKVSGDIVIGALSPTTWHEHYEENRLYLAIPNVDLYIHNGAAKVVVKAEAGSNVIRIFGPVAKLEAYAGVTVYGATLISHAMCMADNIYLDDLDDLDDLNIDLSGTTHTPRPIDPEQPHPDDPGPDDPDPDFPFIPGSGGWIEAHPTNPATDSFVGLYIQESRLVSVDGQIVPELKFEFPSPAELVVESLVLEFSPDQGDSWRMFFSNENLVQTTNEYQNNFAILPAGEFHYRLRAVGGSRDGQYSNVVTTALSTVATTFWRAWSTIDWRAPYAGWVVENASDYELTEAVLDGHYTSYYTWSRIDPFTFAIEDIPGADNIMYATTEDDAGYLILAKLGLRGLNSEEGGFTQQIVGFVPRTRLPNMAFISDVTAEGFILNLHKGVSGLATEGLILSASTETDFIELSIHSITSLDESGARFAIQTDPITADIESLSLENQESLDNWLLVHFTEEGEWHVEPWSVREGAYYEF